MQSNTLRLGAVLGLLSCVGPFSIDMVLPAMPQIADSLSTDVASTQMIIAVFFVAFGVSQLFYGPWSDAVGRKKPLYVGLTIFIIGSVACALAPTIGWLIAARFVQGLGAAVVMVIPRAVIRDVLTGSAATRLMAMVMLVISISPMLAPLAGAGVIAIAPWQMIFVILAVATLLSLALTAFALPETLTPEQRVPIHLGTLADGVRTLFASRSFLLLTFIGGAGMSSFFVFIASAAFVYSGEFGLSPTQFSLAFAVNAIGFFAASQLAATLGERYGMVTMVSKATAGFATFTVTLFVAVAAGFGTLPLIVAFLFCANACLGLVIPATMVMALDDQGEIAGLASSVGGTLQMLCGALLIGLASPFFDGTALPMTGAIALCGVIAFVLSRAFLAGPALKGA